MKSRRGDTKTGIHPRPTRPNSIRGVFANRRSFNRRRATLDDTTRVNRDTSPSREWRGWHRDPSYNYHRDGGRIRAEMRITRLHWYGGGDLSQYRARNKNPVAPNDVCTFHRVLSLSLFYSLFFLFYFFFFSKRRTFIRDAYVALRPLQRPIQNAEIFIRAGWMRADADRPNSSRSLVIGRAYLFFIAWMA